MIRDVVAPIFVQIMQHWSIRFLVPFRILSYFQTKDRRCMLGFGSADVGQRGEVPCTARPPSAGIFETGSSTVHGVAMLLLTYSMHVCVSRDRGLLCCRHGNENEKGRQAKTQLSEPCCWRSFQVSRPPRDSTKGTNCWNRVSGPEPRNRLTPEKLVGTPNSLEAQTLVTW